MPPITRSKAAKASSSKTAKDSSSKTAKASTSKAAKASGSKVAKASRSKVVKASGSKVVKASRSKAVKASRSKAVKAPSSKSTPEETAGSSKAKKLSDVESTPKKSTRQLPVPEPSDVASTLLEESIQDDSDSTWNPHCDYVSEREGLVAATIQLALERGMVLIRATPQVGKTTLLRLLGRHIRDKLHSLEPIWIDWKCREQRNGLSCLIYLADEATKWCRLNARHRPHNPNARKIFLIDEAQNSYPELDFWSQHFKNIPTTSQPSFVLACAYGPTTEFLGGGDTHTPSEAIRIDPSQRIELRPSVADGLCMLFTIEETTTSVKKWALLHKYKLEDGVCEYIQMATGGHPGMMGLLFLFLNSCFPQVKTCL